MDKFSKQNLKYFPPLSLERHPEFKDFLTQRTTLLEAKTQEPETQPKLSPKQMSSLTRRLSIPKYSHRKLTTTNIEVNNGNLVPHPPSVNNYTTSSPHDKQGLINEIEVLQEEDLLRELQFVKPAKTGPYTNPPIYFAKINPDLGYLSKISKQNFKNKTFTAIPIQVGNTIATMLCYYDKHKSETQAYLLEVQSPVTGGAAVDNNLGYATIGTTTGPLKFKRQESFLGRKRMKDKALWDADELNVARLVNLQEVQKILTVCNSQPAKAQLIAAKFKEEDCRKIMAKLMLSLECKTANDEQILITLQKLVAEHTLELQGAKDLQVAEKKLAHTQQHQKASAEKSATWNPEMDDDEEFNIEFNRLRPQTAMGLSHKSELPTTVGLPRTKAIANNTLFSTKGKTTLKQRENRSKKVEVEQRQRQQLLAAKLQQQEQQIAANLYRLKQERIKAIRKKQLENARRLKLVQLQKENGAPLIPITHVIPKDFVETHPGCIRRKTRVANLINTVNKAQLDSQQLHQIS